MSQSWWSRFFGTKQNANETKNEKSLEEQRKDLEETIRINRLRKAAKLTESYADTDYWLTAYADLLARYKDGFALAYPITQPTDRRYGGNFPFWYSEQQLGLIRAQARMVATMSPNAQGLLNGLTSYVIGSGYRYDVVLKPDREVPDRIMIKVQDVIDDFCENNAWTELEQELFWRSREDGEFFLRLFPQESGKMMVRVIEPEQVFMPPGGSLFDYSYGIRTDVDDVCNVIGYAVSYIAPGGEGEKEPNPMATEEVPADRIVHVKVNTKRNIKRGLSDFSYDTLEAFQTAAKLRTNLGEGSAVQAAIAGVRQHDAASYSQVDSFVGSQTDYAQYSPVTQRATDFQQIKSGTFVDIPKGMNFVPPPGAAANAISGHLEVFQALLRSAGNRHNAPEWLVSADASNNNYASSMTAESPFLRHCKRLQEFYKRPFLRVIKAAIENAIDAGKLPTNIMEFIDITATPPELEVQDKNNQAMANQIYAGMGVKSRQTIAHELGLDWDTELTNQQEYAEQMGAASPLPMPGSGPMGPDGLDGGPDDGGPDQGPDGGPDQNAPGLREEFVESVDVDDEEAMQVSGESVGEAERYAHINFSPPKAARDAAARALAARKRKAPSERGMTATGIARARDLVAGKKLSPDTIRRMHSFFSRHEVDKKGESWDSQGKGWQAWNGWGGDAGFAFARKVIRQMDAADAKEAADPAISAKISKLRAEGYPQKQAVAIALSMSRRGELKENQAEANPNEPN